MLNHLIILGTVAGLGAGSAFAATYAETVIADGATGYWKFDETSGTSVTNEKGGTAGNVVGTTLAMGVAGIPGASGTAFNFSTAAEYVNLPDTADTYAEYTLETWVKLDALPVLPTNWANVAHRTNGTAGAFSHINQVGPSGTLLGYLYNGAGVSVPGTTPLVADSWYHLVSTYEDVGGGSYTLKIYVNGSLEGTLPGQPAAAWTGGNAWWVGKNHANNAGYLEGTVDEVAVYGQALTPAQIQSHYTMGSIPEPATFSFLGLAGFGLILRRQR